LARLGAYELLRRISSGSLAEVYEARRAGPRGFAKRVALKRVLPQLAQDPRVARSFCAAARVHAALTHPGVVSVLDFGEADGELYLVMEYVDGVTLSEVLSAAATRKRRVDLGAALYVARELAAALQHAHEHRDAVDAPHGVVHRHLAPGHVLLGRAGEVKLTDFGMRRVAVSELRAVKGLRDELGYVAPEQAQGREAEPRSDLFSLGVILAEMLSGAPLIQGDSAAELLQSLQERPWESLPGVVGHAPPGVVALVQKLLARSPRNRPPSAAHVVAELDRLASAGTARASAHEFALWLADLGVIRLDSNVRLTPRETEALPAVEPPARVELPTLVDDDALKPVTVEAPVSSVEATPSARRRSNPPGLRYRLRRPGGEVVGPLSLGSVLGLIATAKAGLDSELARDGGPFLKLSRAFELTRLASRPLYRFFEPIALLATERHPVERTSLPSHLLRIAVQRRSGLLVQRAGAEQRRVYFEHGAPRASASTDASELLGAQLTRRGVLDPVDLDRVLESGYRSGCQLGESLVRAGLMSDAELTAALSEQRVERLAALFRAQAGELFFVEGAASGEENLGADPAPAGPLLEALRRAYPAAELLTLLGGLERTALRPSATCAELRRALTFTGEEAYAFDLCLRGVKLGLVLREARVRGEAALFAAAFAIFVGLCAGAFVTRAD
jgi:eukaryotic-like serine/threonine-protein kinase